MCVIPKPMKIMRQSHYHIATLLALCPILSQPAQYFPVSFSAVQLSSASARAAFSQSETQGTVIEKATQSAPFHHSAIPSSSPRGVLQHMHE